MYVFRFDKAHGRRDFFRFFVSSWKVAQQKKMQGRLGSSIERRPQYNLYVHDVLIVVRLEIVTLYSYASKKTYGGQ